MTTAIGGRTRAEAVVDTTGLMDMLVHGTLIVAQEITTALGGRLTAFIDLTRVSESVMIMRSGVVGTTTVEVKEVAHLCITLTVLCTEKTGTVPLGLILTTERDSGKGGASREIRSEAI